MNTDIERAVIGAALMNPAAAEKLDAIPAEIFSNAAHFLTCQAIQELRQEGNGTDLLIVANHLRNAGRLKDVGGPAYLTECTESVVNSANIEYHLTILKEKYMQRQMIAHYQSGINRMNAGADIFDEIEATEKKCNDVVLGAVGKVAKPMKDIVGEYLSRLDIITGSEGHLLGVPSGIMELDRYTRGWKAADLAIIAARPSMGKSDLALWLSLTASKSNFKTGYISLEMGEHQCMNRLISMQGLIPKDQTDSNDAGTRKLVVDAASAVLESGIRIIDAGSANVSQLRELCRRLIREGCTMIVIDYLQLINVPGKDRRDIEIGNITRMLKTQIAKEYEIPVMLLSQLSRKVEDRSDKRPMLSDLRDSGNIEQDADLVVFLYRPEYYGFESDEEGNPTTGLMEMIIAKNREGKTGTIPTHYMPQYGRIVGFREKAAMNGHAPF